MPSRRIAPIVQMGRMDEIDEQKELDDYRAGCMALAPEERIAEMRRLSRRLILLDPRNPRSPRIEPVITILRDAF